MRVRSFVGLLLAVGLAVYASILHTRNRALLHERFQLGPETSIPLWGALLALFLVGFLPTAITLVVDTLRRDLAERRARRRLREDEGLAATFRRAADLHADGQDVRAAGELESFLAGKPDDYSGQMLYGEVLRGVGRTDEAIEVHRRAATTHPLSVGVLYQLGADHEKRGEAEIAREIESRILREFPGYGLEVLKGRRAAALGQRDFPEASKLHERVAEMIAGSGDAATLARESTLAQGLEYQKGVRLLEEDSAGQAAEIFRSILAHEPRFIPAHIMLGEAELLEDREEVAVKAWREGYAVTGSPVFLQRIEDHFIEQEEPLAAIETLRALIAEADNDLLPRFYLGRLYYRLEMLDEAAKQLESISERIRSSPTYHFLLGRIHHRRGELARAVEAYGRCLRQLEVGRAEYVCRVCHARHTEWSDACSRCGSWNAIELDFEEERLSPEAVGVLEVPVWGVAEDSGEIAVRAIELEAGAASPRGEPKTPAGGK